MVKLTYIFAFFYLLLFLLYFLISSYSQLMPSASRRNNCQKISRKKNALSARGLCKFLRKSIDKKPLFFYNISCYIFIISAGVAQLVEQLICNQQVGGSSPSTSSIKTAWESCFSLASMRIFLYVFLFDYFRCNTHPARIFIL